MSTALPIWPVSLTSLYRTCRDSARMHWPLGSAPARKLFCHHGGHESGPTHNATSVPLDAKQQQHCCGTIAPTNTAKPPRLTRMFALGPCAL